MNDVCEITLPMMRDLLYSAVVCDALDALGYRHQSPRLQLRPVTGCTKLVGRCKTTLWADIAHDDPDTYELEFKAVDSCKPDDVIVAAAAGSKRAGMWGELLSTAARNGGCVGAIVDGMVRDVATMTEMEFPVFSLGTCVYDSMNRQRVIETDVPVELDGVRFCPGDLVIADVDGVVVVPQEIENEAIQAAWNKVYDENMVRDAIRGGMGAAEAWEKYGIL